MSASPDNASSRRFWRPLRVGSGRSRSPREDAARRQDHSAATAAPCLCGRVVGRGSDYGAIPPLAGSFSDSVGGCSPVRANPSRHAAFEQVRGGIGRWARKLFREAAPQSNRRVTGRVVYDWLARRREVACRWITISGDACPEFNEGVRPARPGVFGGRGRRRQFAAIGQARPWCLRSEIRGLETVPQSHAPSWRSAPPGQPSAMSPSPVR